MNPNAAPFFVPPAIEKDNQATKSFQESVSIERATNRDLRSAAAEAKLDAAAKVFVPVTSESRHQSRESKKSARDFPLSELEKKGLSADAAQYEPSFEASSSSTLSANASEYRYKPTKAGIPTKTSTLTPTAKEFVPPDSIQRSSASSGTLSAPIAYGNQSSGASGSSEITTGSFMSSHQINGYLCNEYHNSFPAQLPTKQKATNYSNPPICKFFAKGVCAKGITCQFSHQTTNNNDLEYHFKKSGSSVKPIEPSIKIRNDTEKTSPPAGIPVEEGLVCHFGPGLTVEQVVFTNPDIRTLLISGLPTFATEASVMERLLPYGTVSSLTVQGNSTNYSTSNSKSTPAQKYATAVFEDPADARKACHALHGTSPSDWHISFGSAKLGAAVQKQYAATTAVSVQLKSDCVGSGVAPTVKVQWYKPTFCGWAHFSSQHEAKIAARRCQGMNFRGCIISTKYQEPPPNNQRIGRLPLQRTLGKTILHSVWLGGLDERADNQITLRTAIEKTAKVKVESVSLSTPPFKGYLGPKIVQDLLCQHGGPLTMFEVSSINNSNQKSKNDSSSKERALAKFVNASDAERACQFFRNNPKVAKLGGTSLFLQRVYVAKYTFPSRIAESLRSSLEEAFRAQSSLRYSIHHNAQTGKASISISADDANLLLRTKESLKPLLVGTILEYGGDDKSGKPVWNHGFSTIKFQQKLRTAIGSNAQVVWCDSQRRMIRIFGPIDHRKRISELVLEFVSGYQETVAVCIDKKYFDRILQEGPDFLTQLITACGGTKISLDLKSRSLLVQGSQAAAKRVQQKIMHVFEQGKYRSEHDCPICFCPPDETVVILSECKHIYCKDCFDSWVSGSNLCSFPLTCLSESCNARVQMHDLELDEVTLSNLLRASFDDHVRKNSDTFRFCPAVTCPGVYKVLIGNTCESPCSSCCEQICTACNASHSPQSCEEYALATLPPDRVRLKVIEEILTLRCPRCEQAFMDFDGCFALSCSVCPCNFCGWCLMDCGSDAHPHVKNCPQKHPGADTYFGTREQFESAQAKTRTLKLIEFLKGYEIDERQKILKSLQKELDDLKISIKE